MKNKVIIIIILVSLVACDIPGRIELANTSSKNAVYRYISLNKVYQIQQVFIFLDYLAHLYYLDLNTIGLILK